MGFEKDRGEQRTFKTCGPSRGSTWRGCYTIVVSPRDLDLSHVVYSTISIQMVYKDGVRFIIALALAIF